MIGSNSDLVLRIGDSHTALHHLRVAAGFRNEGVGIIEERSSPGRPDPATTSERMRPLADDNTGHR
jgi:hypothetical protein